MWPLKPIVPCLLASWGKQISKHVAYEVVFPKSHAQLGKRWRFGFHGDSGPTLGPSRRLKVKVGGGDRLRLFATRAQVFDRLKQDMAKYWQHVQQSATICVAVPFKLLKLSALLYLSSCGQNRVPKRKGTMLDLPISITDLLCSDRIAQA